MRPSPLLAALLLSTACASGKPAAQSPAPASSATAAPAPPRVDAEGWRPVFENRALARATRATPIGEARGYIALGDKRATIGALALGDDPGFATEFDRASVAAAIAAAFERLPDAPGSGWPATSPCGGGPRIEQLRSHFDVQLAVQPGHPTAGDIVMIADGNTTLHPILSVAFFTNRPVVLAVRDSSGRPAVLPLRFCADAATPAARTPKVIELAVLDRANPGYIAVRSIGRLDRERNLLGRALSAPRLGSAIRELAFGAERPIVRVRSRSAGTVERLIGALDRLLAAGLAPAVIAQPDADIDMLKIKTREVQTRGPIRRAELNGDSAAAKQAAACLARAAFEGREPPQTKFRVELSFLKPRSVQVTRVDVSGLSAETAECVRALFAGVKRRQYRSRKRGFVTLDLESRLEKPRPRPQRFEGLTGSGSFSE